VAERIDAFAASLPDSIGRLREGELALTALRDLVAILREPLRPAMPEPIVVVDAPVLESAPTVSAADDLAVMPVPPTSHSSSLSIALATDSHTPSDVEDHAAQPPVSAGLAAAGVSLGDVTVPAGMEVVAGTAFTKRWRVLNASPAGWPAGSVLVPLSGVFTAASTLSAAVGPGGETDVAVPLVAPDHAGPAAGAWMLYGPDGQALLREPLVCDIEVVDAPAPAPLRRSVLGRSALAGSGAALSSSVGALQAPATPPAVAAPVAALVSGESVGEAADEWEMVPVGARSGPVTPPAGLPAVFDADALAASLATPHDATVAAPERALPDEVAASLAAELGREIARLQTEIEWAEQVQRERLAAAVVAADSHELVEDEAVIAAPAEAEAEAAVAPAAAVVVPSPDLAPAAAPVSSPVLAPAAVVEPIPTLAVDPVPAAVTVAPAPAKRIPSQLPPPPPPVPIVLASAAPPAVAAVPFGALFAPTTLPPPLMYPLPPAPPAVAPAAVPPPLPARPRAGQFWLPDAPPAIDMPAWMRSPFAAPDAPAPARAPAAPVQQQQPQQQQQSAPHGRRGSQSKLLPGEEVCVRCH
jgi:hypothetical protein